MNIEMKVRANAYRDAFTDLERDLEKLIKEAAFGAASFHVLQESTELRLLRGYGKAYAVAKRNTTHLKSIAPGWFVLFTFDRRTAVARWQAWGDIGRCLEGDFADTSFSVADLHG